MLICLLGASCTGKTTVSNLLKEKLKATIYNGKDYLKLAKSPSEAVTMFKKVLSDVDKNIIYVVTELDDFKLVPSSSYNVLFTASLATVKDRFAKRMNGKIISQIEKMLEKKLELWSVQPYNLLVNSDENSADEIAELILKNVNY